MKNTYHKACIDNESIFVRFPQKFSYGNRAPPTPCLHLVFDSSSSTLSSASANSTSSSTSSVEVRIYETTFSLVDAETASAKVASDSCLDVCSPKFDRQRAFDEVVNAGKGRIVADVLLDQKVQGLIFALTLRIQQSVPDNMNFSRTTDA